MRHRFFDIQAAIQARSEALSSELGQVRSEALNRCEAETLRAALAYYEAHAKEISALAAADAWYAGPEDAPFAFGNVDSHLVEAYEEYRAALLTGSDEDEENELIHAACEYFWVHEADIRAQDDETAKVSDCLHGRRSGCRGSPGGCGAVR